MTTVSIDSNHRSVQSAESDGIAITVSALTHDYPVAKKPSRRRGKHTTPTHDEKQPTRQHALDNVSLSIRRGEIFGILGPNGSGKSTLFRILATVLHPSGPVESLNILDSDVLTQPDDVRRKLGVVFQSPSLDVKLTARENLLHQGHLYGLSGNDLKTKSESLLTYFNLADRADEFVERFSGGMRRRVELAKSLLHDPELLLLDEPATGLDPGARRDLWQQLEQLRSERNQTVALTTHLMDEADRCDRLAVLADGKIVAIDTPNALKARIGGDVLTLTPAGSPSDEQIESLRQELESTFAPWTDNKAPVQIAGKIRLEREGGPAFLASLTEAFPGRFENMTVGQPTLEDVYLHLTGHTLWQDRS